MSVYICDNLWRNHSILLRTASMILCKVCGLIYIPRTQGMLWFRTPVHPEIKPNGSKPHRKARKHRDFLGLPSKLLYKAKGFILPYSYFRVGRNTAIWSKSFLVHCDKSLRIFDMGSAVSYVWNIYDNYLYQNPVMQTADFN